MKVPFLPLSILRMINPLSFYNLSNGDSVQHFVVLVPRQGTWQGCASMYAFDKFIQFPCNSLV